MFVRSETCVRQITYAAPGSVEAAAAILAEHGARARMLAGGTDLIVQIREWLRDVDVVVDAKHIPELMDIGFADDGAMTLGAATPCYRIYGDERVARTYPGLIDAVSMIGGTAIQGRASVGGNLCNSGPAGDSIPPLIVYSAMCNIAGPDGRRSVAAEDFCTAPGRNVLGAGELLVSLTFPAQASGAGAHYLRFIPRNEMDIAVVGAGAHVRLDGDGIVESARISVGAVAPTPLLVEEAGEALAGRQADEAGYELAAAASRKAATPIDDMRGTVEYRKHMTGVLTVRALRGAVMRAKGGRVNGH